MVAAAVQCTTYLAWEHTCCAVAGVVCETTWNVLKSEALVSACNSIGPCNSTGTQNLLTGEWQGNRYLFVGGGWCVEQERELVNSRGTGTVE